MTDLSRRRAFGLALAAPAVALATPALAVPTPAPVVPRLPLTTDWKSARYLIMPDYFRDNGRSKTQHDNTWTIHHQWMMRATPDNPFWGPMAHVNSRTYREWLEEGGYWQSPEEPGIPPHISFGGAVVAGRGDPMFKPRWVEYASREFGAGWPGYA